MHLGWSIIIIMNRSQKKLRVKYSIASVYDNVYEKMLDNIYITQEELYKLRSQINEIKQNSAAVANWENAAENICLCVCNQVGNFPGLPLIAIGLLMIIEDEEITFWVIMGVIYQPWFFPFIDKNGIYGLEFHLYILSRLIGKLSGNNDTNKFILKILLT